MYISELEVYFTHDFKLGVWVSQTLYFWLSHKIAEVLHIQERLLPQNILYVQSDEQLTSYFKSQNLWQMNCCMPDMWMSFWEYFFSGREELEKWQATSGMVNTNLQLRWENLSKYWQNLIPNFADARINARV